MGVYLYGASGHCKVILDNLRQGGVSVRGIFDDASKKVSLKGVSILGPFNNESWNSEHRIVIAIGNNRIRRRIANSLNVQFDTAIHPNAIIAEDVEIGDGTVMMAGAVVNSDTIVGKHCIINTNANVDHDCRIDDFAHISPGAVLTGGVRIGEGTQVGAGASLIPGVQIGKWATIGAGAVVLKDVPDYATAVGNPARIITIKKEKNNE